MKSIRDIANLDHFRHAMNIVACASHVNARPGKIRGKIRIAVGTPIAMCPPFAAKINLTMKSALNV